MSAPRHTIDAGRKDCIYYKVKWVLLWWDPPKEDQMAAPKDSDKERDLFSDSDYDDYDSPGPEEIVRPAREKAYQEALGEWRQKRSKEVDWWLDVGWVTFAVFNDRVQDFLARQHLPYDVSNVHNALRFRRAILLSLRSVEGFHGEITHSMREASTFFQALGRVRVSDAPEDLVPRVEAAMVKLRGMDEEDLAMCYVGGSHWMIHEFRTLESMVEPARGIGYEVFVQPVFQPMRRR